MCLRVGGRQQWGGRPSAAPPIGDSPTRGSVRTPSARIHTFKHVATHPRRAVFTQLRTKNSLNPLTVPTVIALLPHRRDMTRRVVNGLPARIRGPTPGTGGRARGQAGDRAGGQIAPESAQFTPSPGREAPRGRRRRRRPGGFFEIIPKNAPGGVFEMGHPAPKWGGPGDPKWGRELHPQA